MYGLVGIVGAAVAMQTAPVQGVAISGAVKKPGTAVVTRMQSLHEAVDQLGGFRPEADRRSIRIVSKTGAERVVDLTKGGILPAVYPGDRVVVPAADPAKTILVQGDVGFSGAFDFRPGMSVKDAVALAQPSPMGNLESVRILRPDGKGSYEVHTANLLAMNAGAEALRPGDRVYVPRSGFQASDRQLLTIVVIGLILVVIFK
jgi:protein involved in polysaccharide export with SLBB domain